MSNTLDIVDVVDKFESKLNFTNLEETFESNLSNDKVTIFRLDGHSFSKFTSNFNKPFDDGFTQAMKTTAEKAFNYFDFSLGFVGSDEITLCIFPKLNKNNDLCDLEFAGRIQKMTTLLAGFISVTFYKEFSKYHNIEDFTPHFDCRVFQVDTVQNAIENVMDRICYTLRNSKMMFAQHFFSAKALHKKSSTEAIRMVLDEKKLDFYDNVSADNRVGNVLFNKKVDCTKEIVNRDGDTENKIVTFQRNQTVLQNMGCKEAMSLNEMFV